MTARLDVTPKTTEQNRIVCTSKSEAEVTNNKKLRLRYCTIDATKLTTDRHEASRGFFATAELLVDVGAVLEQNRGLGRHIKIDAAERSKATKRTYRFKVV